MLILSVLVVLLIVINSVTYKPFISVFQFLMNKTTVQGNIGEWEPIIDNVKKIGVETIDVDGCPSATVSLYAPDSNVSNLPIIVYIHGGGWCTGTASSVEWFAKLLASNGYVVANVDYSLAPEYAYPTSTFQLIEVVNYLYENADDYGYNADKIFIGGNSAGAHLASQLGALVSNPEYANEVGVSVRVPIECISGIILYNGVYNFDTVGECKFPFFDKLAWAYTGKKKYTDYDRIDELSTVKHVTEDYPAVFITVGDADPLQSQTTEFIQKLEENKVNVRKLLWTDSNTDLWHDYMYEQNRKEAQEALRDTIQFLDEH